MIWSNVARKMEELKEEKKDWAVILVLPDTKINEALSNLLSEDLHMTRDFTMNMVLSSPILLLDGLDQPMAEKFKKYLEFHGGQACVTKDKLVKGKCSSLKWKNQPSTAFLDTFRAPSASGSLSSAQPSDLVQALENEKKRSTELMDKVRELESLKNVLEDTSRREKDERYRIENELGMVKKQYGDEASKVSGETKDNKSLVVNLRKEVETLNHAKDKADKALKEAQIELDALKNTAISFQSEKHNLQAMLDQARSNHEELNRQFQDLKERAVLPEELEAMRVQLEEARERANQLEDQNAKSNESWRLRLNEVENRAVRSEEEYRRLEDEHRTALEFFDQKLIGLKEALDNSAREASQLRQRNKSS